MTTSTTEPTEMSVTAVRRRFLALVDELAEGEGVVRVTKHGRPAIAMVPWRAYEQAQEILATVEILSDPELVEQIRQGEREIEAGEGIGLEELEAQISRDINRADQ
jgi:prevent-host-death family protein